MPIVERRWGTCIYSHCANLSKASCQYSLCQTRRKVGRLGVSWRDGLVCGKWVCLTAALPSESLTSPGNGQMGYSGNQCSLPSTVRLSGEGVSDTNMPNTPLLRQRVAQSCVGSPTGDEHKAVTWLILPVVICLSQRLSHACLSINCLYCETANGSLNQLEFI